MNFVLKKIGLSGLIIILVSTLSNCYGQYSGGSGTSTDPFQIASYDDLLEISNSPEDWDQCFILKNDIDASETYYLNNGKGFSPIGCYDTAFIGVFNGDNYVISNLFINRENEYNIGLFGYIARGKITGLVLDSCNITGESNIGVLAGSVVGNDSDTTGVFDVHIKNSNTTGYVQVGGMIGNLGSNINNCSFEGNVTGYYSIIGGLVGYSSGSIISNSYAKVTLYAGAYSGGIVGNNHAPVYNCSTDVTLVKNTDYTDCYFGGIAGKNISSINKCNTIVHIDSDLTDLNYIGGIVSNNSGNISSCFSELEIRCPGINYIGGIASINEANIINSYSNGVIEGNDWVGGIIGINKHGSQTLNSYSSVHVIGNNYTGAFIGENSYFGTISSCYSSGKVDCSAMFSGGFVGLNRSTAYTNNCFYDKPTTGKSTGTGMDHNGQNQKVIDLTTDEFSDTLIFANAGWQFGTTSDSPWHFGIAPDGFLRPIFYYQTFTIRFEANENGTIIPNNPFEETVSCGSNSSPIEAIPDEGYYFLGWQSAAGDSISNSNPIIVKNVIKDSLLIAVFDKIDGIADMKNEMFSVYPNPSSCVVTLDIANTQNTKSLNILIFNCKGQIFLRQKIISSKTKLDISMLKKGLYIIKLQSGQTIHTEKIIVY